MINLNNQPVVVTDIKMPFWSMVGFMVKWAFASIPAIFIVVVAGGVSFTLFAIVSATLNGGGKPVATNAYVPQMSSALVGEKPWSTTTADKDVPDRCKGNPDIEKCIALTREMQKK